MGERPFWTSLAATALLLAPLGWAGADLAPDAFGLAGLAFAFLAGAAPAVLYPELDPDPARRLGLEVRLAGRVVLGVAAVAVVVLDPSWLFRARLDGLLAGAGWILAAAAVPAFAFLLLRPAVRGLRRRCIRYRSGFTGALETAWEAAFLGTALAAGACLAGFLAVPRLAPALRGAAWQDPPDLLPWLLAVALPAALLAGLGGLAFAALLSPLARQLGRRLARAGLAAAPEPQVPAEKRPGKEVAGRSAETPPQEEAAAPADLAGERDAVLGFVLQELRSSLEPIRRYLEEERRAPERLRPAGAGDSDPGRGGSASSGEGPAAGADLAALLRRLVAREASRSRAERQVEIVLQRLAAEPGPVRADPADLESVLGGLLRDAVQHSRPGGVVRLTLKRKDGRETVAVELRPPAAAEAVSPDTREAVERLGGSLSVSRQGEESTVVAVQLPSPGAAPLA